MDLKLEVIVIPVSDVDRAKAFYERLGFRLDIDLVANEDYRVIQFTPPGSAASIIFGKGVTSAQPGSIDGLVLAVYDIDAARGELLSRGANVSEVFHDAGGGSRRPFLRLLCLIQRSRRQRLAAPGDQDAATGPLKGARAMDVPMLAELLRETAEHHDHYEKTHAEHHWWDWYAPYLSARQNGTSPEEASAIADRYMEEVLHILPR
jgi:catechol 2,3-dioxygenase-like lactoylglutathione lyase family enzyme